jgi:hypothetical protein
LECFSRVVEEPAHVADKTSNKGLKGRLMTQHSQIRDMAARMTTGDTPGTDTGRHCAYNHTRQRFLSADVDAGDFTSASLDARLPGLSADNGEGLWLMPFRGIAPTSVRVPVDLLYLDREGTVIEAVESFPISRASASSRPSTSVLVLPAGAIHSTETRSGDRLILCPPAEMKVRLQQLAAGADPASEAAAKDAQARSGIGRVLQWEDRVRAKGPAERGAEEENAQPASLVPAAQQDVRQEAIAVEPARPAAKSAKSGRTWLQKLLALEPSDPRRSARESVAGLSAYFFTGGAPVAHSVRDISLTGMYVFTSERWYIGTMLRITLTDRAEPTTERSITLNATVARWGNDGVGLKFILHAGKGSREHQADGMYNATSAADIERFLLRLRASGA